MESCQPSVEVAATQRLQRPFLVAAYLPDESGRWTASVMPTTCPTSDGGEACRVTVDYHRERKTGPCVPVAVLKCATHGNGFTLYPCGHVPYGREAVAPVGLDGKALSAASSAPEFVTIDSRDLGSEAERSCGGIAWMSEFEVIDGLTEGLERRALVFVGRDVEHHLD